MSERSAEYGESIIAASLDRPLGAIRLEVVAFLTVVIASLVAHLYGLERMAMHHDESIHAWLSWRFYEGRGAFTCAGGRVAATYCYDPVYHGPALYILTLASYWLFGDGDLQARLPQALAGVALTASTWWLRPYIGWRGVIIAAIVLGFTPTLLYFTRFARHDGLMVLWTLWIVIGFFRYIDTGQARFLYLFAAAVALAVGTHELYYILAFIFGWFLIIRLAYENAPRRRVTIGLLAIVALALIVELVIVGGLWDGRLTASLRADGLALLFFTTAGAGLLAARVWHREPIITPRLVALWHDQRPTLWIALSILAGLYVVQYSTFFADPRGIIDGLYQGLAYWLGSQQEFKRGDQPWYYYLTQMSLYEPLALLAAVAATAYLFSRRSSAPPPPPPPDDAPEPAAAPPPTVPAVSLVPLFLAFWFIGALVIFSWAGEKMPWLNAHIALPANLLLAWSLARLLGGLGAIWRAGVIGLCTIVGSIAGIIAIWRFATPAADQAGQAQMLQGALPVLVLAASAYAILELARSHGSRATVAAMTLSITLILGAYTTRASWMVVYQHPDTPREPLVYTQTAPEVPLIVREIHELAAAQTRNVRSPEDPAGGLSMPVIMDNGDPAAAGEGSLAWPYQWYLRHFQRLEVRDAAFFREAQPDSFIVEPAGPGAERLPAPVVLVSRNSSRPEALESLYVRRYDAKLNWWFPEGNRCDPASAGYKRFYFAYPGAVADATKACPGLDAATIPPFWAPLLWPFDRSHWADTWRYVIYRDLPDGMALDGREMQVWIRRDLAPGGGGTVAVPRPAQAAVAFAAERRIADVGLNEPRSLAIAADGTIVVADTLNHRIQFFAPDGTLQRSVGSFGAGPGQFNEPRGIAIDAAGNIYVADTWNARIVKLAPDGAVLGSWGEGREDFGSGRRASPTDGTLAGNAADPLGFFGPRAVAVDAAGRVYIADTGNKRVVVTDGAGRFLLQWGAAGAAAGQFDEPIGLAVDAAGRVYVGDTWNRRVQVFAPRGDGTIEAQPIATLPVTGWAPQTYDDPYLGVGPEGQIFVGVPTRGALVYGDLGGELLRWTGSAADGATLTAPAGIAVAPDGAIWVVDRSDGSIYRFAIPLPAMRSAALP